MKINRVPFTGTLIYTADGSQQTLRLFWWILQREKKTAARMVAVNLRELAFLKQSGTGTVKCFTIPDLFGLPVKHIEIIKSFRLPGLLIEYRYEYTQRRFSPYKRDMQPYTVVYSGGHQLCKLDGFVQRAKIPEVLECL